MNIDPYVDRIHTQLDAAAEAGGEDALVLARRLAAPLDAAIRLAVQEALAAAAEEITVELAPGSVEVRLRGREPQFVVTMPAPPAAADEHAGDDDLALSAIAPQGGEGEDQPVARVNVRMPEHLKARVDRAADAEGLSINAWLVRAAASRLERSESGRRPERRAPSGAQRYTGWVR
ncbi:MAG TPA: toxin-antitoxin system HicB family antitoxin [Actinomycetota bacterium]